MIEGLIKTTINELNLSLTLRSGQAFRWRKHSDNNWIGIIGNKYVIELRQQNELNINYKVFNPLVVTNNRHKVKEENNELISSIDSKPKSNKFNKRSKDDHKIKDKKLKTDNNSKTTAEVNQKFFDQLISDYFRLDVDLCQLYEIWSKSDANFAKISKNFKGIRILRQEPIETLFSFICSANNNIQRIETMIDKLCKTYGNVLFDDLEGIGTVYSFPDIESLANDSVVNVLNGLGFGYRSKFIQKTAQKILDLHPKCPQLWFQSLKQMSYSEARHELIQMPGIGPKVADCIALMALDHLQSIPVDTHVWQIAVNRYLPHLRKNKSLTNKSYQEIGDFFRDRFGQMAGWAHSVLFCAELKQFKHLVD